MGLGWVHVGLQVGLMLVTIMIHYIAPFCAPYGIHAGKRRFDGENASRSAAVPQRVQFQGCPTGKGQESQTIWRFAAGKHCKTKRRLYSLRIGHRKVSKMV